MLLPACVLGQQIPVGSWRTHQTYRDAYAVAQTPNHIYCATSTGFFRIDPKTKQIQTLSRIEGLSDAVVSVLAYDSVNASLIVVYANGNIDLLTEKGVENSNGIKLFNFPSKKINHIQIDPSRQKAYLSANFGLVELDLRSKKITNSYLYTGNQARQIEFFATAVLGDSVFATTSQGLRKASLRAGVNLADYRNWTPIPTPIPTQTKNLAAFNNKLYIAVNFDSLYRYENGRLMGLSIAARQNNYLMLKSIAGKLFLSLESLIIEIDKDESFRLLDARGNGNLSLPRDLTVRQGDLGTELWVADAQKGLVQLNRQSENAAYFNPNGVYDVHTHDIIYSEGKIFVPAGGYQAFALPDKNQAGFYIFDDNRWLSYNTSEGSFDSRKINFSTDITSAAFDRNNWIVGSYGGGLFRLVGDSLVKYPTSFFYFITSIAAARDKMYIARHPEGSGGCVLELDLQTNQLSFVSSPNFRADQVLIDNAGTIWLRNADELLALDLQTGRTVSSSQSGSIFAGKLFTDMALSPKGSLWLATNDGLLEVVNLAATFREGTMAARFPRINQERALRNTFVNCLSTDGGGRVWVGTNDGLRLFNSDVSRQIEHFTTANSPILSDEVTKLKANPLTGEIFVATPKGIISYRSDATQVDFGQEPQMVIFPNPVPSGYGGLIALSGLPRDGNIKITDTGGSLVRELTANGGTVAWDGKDYNGRRAKAGIYFVFVSDVAAENGYLGKIALLE